MRHTQTTNGNVNVQVILLESTTSEQIQLYELEVYSSGESHNIASSGVARQSSTLRVDNKGADFFAAHKSNDSNNRTFSHTNDSNAWLRIDLPTPSDVDSVIILNRGCAEEAILLCLCRLSFAKLSLLTSNGVTVATRTIGNTCDVQTVVEDFSLRSNSRLFAITDIASSIMDSVEDFALRANNHETTELELGPSTSINHGDDDLEREPTIAIFFNTFSGSNTDHAKAIISSQLQAINSQPLLDESPLFYTRIGNFSWEWPHEDCRGVRTHHNQTIPRNFNHTTLRKCTQIAAIEKGSEMVTLAQLHNYCQEPGKSFDKVVYLHSKGTYTSNPANDSLRTILMKAILSTECLKGNCDACSTLVQFIPSPHYMGNMWVADCSHISKLLSPNEFQKRKGHVVVKIEEMKNRTKKSPPWMLGIDRYAAEHWLFSHPDISPCEVFSSSDKNPTLIYGRNISVGEFNPPKLQHIQETMITKKANSRGNFWYDKECKLLEFKELYGKVPTNGSWFYMY